MFHRDLPTVSGALGRPVKVRQLKGRANYLCNHRLELAVNDPVIFLEQFLNFFGPHHEAAIKNATAVEAYEHFRTTCKESVFNSSFIKSLKLIKYNLVIARSYALLYELGVLN